MNAPVLVKQGNGFQRRQPGLALEVNCISHVIRAVIPGISWSCCHLTKSCSRLSDLLLDNIVRSSSGKLPRTRWRCHSCPNITTGLRVSSDFKMIAVIASSTALSRHR